MKERWYDREKKRFGKNPLDLVRGHRRTFVLSLAGGRCQFCGYSRYLGNLVFHHLDSKKLALSLKYFQHRLEVLLPEIQKCVVCCHNCHGELHAGLLTGVEEKYRIFQGSLMVLGGKKWGDFKLDWKDVKNMVVT
jgi:hypothetical protein